MPDAGPLDDGLVELELMPGVFLVGRPQQVNEQRELAYENGTYPREICQHEDLIESELARLENSILHLLRSNDELEAVRLEDPEFDLAFQENITVIARQQTRRTNLEAKLAELRGTRSAASNDALLEAAIEVTTTTMSHMTVTQTSVAVSAAIAPVDARIGIVAGGAASVEPDSAESQDDGVFL